MENTNYVEELKTINEGKNKKYKIFTMGCQLNENDSEKIAGMLEESGYSKTDNENEADVIVFNTCCVRENAEDRLFGKLGEVKKYKEAKGTIIVIGGCMMQEKEMVEKLNQSYRFVDVVFGPHTIEKLPEDIYRSLISKKHIEDILDIDGKIIEGLPVKREDTIKASVPIMNGCDNFCTYCIVPYVRGRERSRLPQNIIDEIEDLAKAGYKEIMLLGQNVNSYLVSEKKKNKDLSYEVVVEGEKLIVNSFATLLNAVDTISGIEKIRFISPHPKDFTDDVIEAIKKSTHISHLIHFPLQAGGNNTLRRMNRNYTKEQYLERAFKIKNEIPDATLTTDIIVGFPGETEEDFLDTLDVIKKVRFEQVFMFIYSRRKGTPGDLFEDQIPEDVKHERFNRLKALSDSIVEEINNSYVGREEKILVEGFSKTNDNMLTGRTDSNRIVIFEGKEDLIGKVIKIKIIESHIWYLTGKYDTI